MTMNFGAPDAPHDPTNPRRGVKLLHDPVRNKGTAFTDAEREELGLRGLLPPAVLTQELQVKRVMGSVRSKSNDLDRYIAITGLQDRNETLFYRVLIDNLDELMPIVYTPTVGQACQEYAHIFRRPRGLFISANDRGRIAELLDHWPHSDVRIIVVTDGERILGLGDLGADGMGIPVGKLSLYTACAGIHPTQCLPVTLDVGTENQALLDDPLYIGLTQRRLRGTDFDDMVEEFISAASEAFPDAVIQLEDFATLNAFRLLDEYRNKVCTFDDDIQGTAAVALAGLYSAQRITGGTLRDGQFLFFGAGEAGIGIGNLLVAALQDEGLSEEEAIRRCWFLDSRGLVVKSRTNLAPHKLRFAHDHEHIAGLAEAVEKLRPTALIGAAGVSAVFTQEVVERMAAINDRPIVFALSNPTSMSECTAEQAYRWSDGRAVFASGSPFDPVEYQGTRFVPGQGNNAYVFPGVGLGVIVSRARHVTDEMFFVASRILANEVSDEDIAMGRIYPPLESVRDVSAAIAEGVAKVAFERGLARESNGDNLTRDAIREAMFEPDYTDLSPAAV
jgi:malate dehydrogenase (oxaloacetate-decarboxylating)(NADP+)